MKNKGGYAFIVRMIGQGTRTLAESNLGLRSKQADDSPPQTLLRESFCPGCYIRVAKRHVDPL